MEVQLQTDSDHFEYTTSVEGSLAIIREINRITFSRTDAPVDDRSYKRTEAGVDFSKVKHDETVS